MESLIPSSINFTILASILFFKLRLPMRQFVSRRHETIYSQVTSVQKELKTAQDQHEAFAQKLKNIDLEMHQLLQEVKRESVELRQKVISEAREMARDLVLGAQGAAGTLFAELRGELYTELSAQILDRAEGLLQNCLTGDDRSRIRHEFSRHLESVE
jgi:F0F1-type ATP synthase membrane subunit b/b'